MIFCKESCGPVLDLESFFIKVVFMYHCASLKVLAGLEHPFLIKKNNTKPQKNPWSKQRKSSQTEKPCFKSMKKLNL